MVSPTEEKHLVDYPSNYDEYLKFILKGHKITQFTFTKISNFIVLNHKWLLDKGIIDVVKASNWISIGIDDAAFCIAEDDYAFKDLYDILKSQGSHNV